MKEKIGNSIVVIFAEVIALILLGQIFGGIVTGLIYGIFTAAVPSAAMADPVITAVFYGQYIGIWILTVLYIWLRKGIRPILQTTGRKLTGNNWKNILLGLLIGFGMNALCVLAAWKHQDIVLKFDAFPVFPVIIVFLTVAIQSSAEEMLCRGLLYQRLMHKYQKPVVAIVGNSLLFAALHLLNDGVTVISVINIFLVGVLTSFLVYYMDSLWCAMAVHTAWNFTQNIIFGLPNSGIVMPFSIFKLDAGTATDSLFYNVGFGIEGTVLADLVLLAACILLYLWGRKHGKKPYDVFGTEQEAVEESSVTNGTEQERL